MAIQQLIGICAGILTAVSLIPQFVKSVREKRVDDISPFMFIVLFAGNGLWLYYGVLLNDVPIMATNAFSVVMDAAMLTLKIKYGRR